MAADAQGAEHRGGAGVEGGRRGVCVSDSGAGGAVRFLDKSHKQNPLIGSILDLLLREQKENVTKKSSQGNRSPRQKHFV